MNAACEFIVVPKDLISDSTAEHIEKFGKPAEKGSVELSASLRNWEACGLLRKDGTVDQINAARLYFLSGGLAMDVMHEVKTRVAANFIATGNLTAMTIDDIIERNVSERAQAAAERELASAAADRADKERSSRVAQEKAAFESDKLAWVAEFGSTRLKRAVKEEIECDAIYRDERIAAERGEWCWYSTSTGMSSTPRNPTEQAFELLDAARKFDAQAKLTYHVVKESYDEDTGETIEGWRGYTCAAEFLGATIVYGLPAEYR